jgi:hypothetical protein
MTNVVLNSFDLDVSLRKAADHEWSECEDSVSGSTATPSEVASAHGSSPRHVQEAEDLEFVTCEHAKARWSDLSELPVSRPVRQEMTSENVDEPLDDMFGDSDDDVGPASPSKAAKRRMRRKRQRDGLRDVVCSRPHIEAQMLEESGRSCHRSNVMLSDLGLGFALSTSKSDTGNTSHAQLDSRVPSVHQALLPPQVGVLPSPVCAQARFMNTCPSTTPGTAFKLTSSVAGSPCTVMSVAVAEPPPRTTVWSPSPVANSITETLRMLIGTNSLLSGEELAAKLQAAIPEVYED